MDRNKNNGKYKIVPSSYLLLIKNGKILLARRINTGFQDGNYGLVAGHGEKNETARTGFFRKAIDRISGISLKNDIVIPYEGVKKALGEEIARQRVKLLDFSFSYTHENPFPVLKSSSKNEVDKSFLQVFNTAAAFLA